MILKQFTFLSLQGSYSVLDISLFKNSKHVCTIKEKNIKASSLLIPIIKNLFEKNSLKLSDLDFIATDQGPGAFTSLRVTISTVNGLSFANKIPLIGIDGLDAIYFEAKDKTNNKNIVAILNAYNNDVFYAFSNNGKLQKGYKKIENLISDLKNKYGKDEITFVGNGYKLHKELVSKELHHNFIDLEISSSEQIAKMALKLFEKEKGLSYKLKPLYLKSQSFAIRPTKNKS